MHTEKALGRSSRFEPLHLACSSSYHLVRVLGPIVLAKLLFMVARQPDVVEGSAVGAQLIGYHHLWREALFSEQLANQLERRNACLACVEPAHRGSRPSWSTARHRYIHLPAIRRPSHRDASDRSAENGTAVPVAIIVRISPPSYEPSRKKRRALARQGVPRRRSSLE